MLQFIGITPTSAEASWSNVAGDMSARENPMSGKKVNDILILTNITIAATGAAVCDHCTSRLAFVAYVNSLRKYIKTGIF